MTWAAGALLAALPLLPGPSSAASPSRPSQRAEAATAAAVPGAAPAIRVTGEPSGFATGPAMSGPTWLGHGLMTLTARHGDIADSDLSDSGAVRLWVVRLAGRSLLEEQLERYGHPARGGPVIRPAAGELAEALTERRRALVAADARVARAVQERGGRVVEQTASLLRALVVYGDTEAAASWRALPGVVQVLEAPRLKAELGRAGPHIGADRLRALGPYSGQGVLVAVLDSGIDYGHRALGGHGDPDRYRGNDPDQVEPGSFPTTKVAGGVDLAGSTYAADCPLFPPPELVCSRFPQPDDDPMDEVYLDGMDFQGHGSHVASIIASDGASPPGEPPIAEGMAPAARLLAIKVFGSPRSSGDQVLGETALTVSGLEWLARHNLGELLDHGIAATDASGRRQAATVLNLSLGTPYGSQGQLYDFLLGRLAALGISVVASGGNAGDLPFATGGPAWSRSALSVAASYGPQQQEPRLAAAWAEAAIDVASVEAAEWLTPRLAVAGDLRDLPLAYVGDACPAADGSPRPPVEDPLRAIALIARGGCYFTQKLARAQDLGARAAVVFSTAGAPILSMRGDCGRLHGHCFRIPAVMIDQASGERLRQLRQGGVPVSASLGVKDVPELTDRIASSSSRGPAARGGLPLKPQLTAPGAAVWAAAAGSGSEGMLRGGSSMAAPQASGLLALLTEARRGRQPSLGPLDLAALLMNQARPLIHGGGGAAVAVSRQGAGLPDAAASATARVLVRAGDIAELSFGLSSVAGQTMAIRRPMTVTHLAGDALTLVPEARFRDPEDPEKGYRLRFEPPEVTVAGGASVGLMAILDLDPNSLRPWTLPGRGRAETLSQTAVLETLEADGQVEIAARGAPDTVLARLPFHALARRQACAQPQTRRLAPTAEGPALLMLRNDCTEAGGAALYRGLGEDPVDVGLAGGLDLRRIGVRSYTLPPQARDPRFPDLPLQLLEFVLETRSSVILPLGLRPRAYFDIDADGDWDKVGQVLGFPGPVLGSFVTDVDPVSLKPDWAALPVDPRTGTTSFFVSQVPFDLESQTVVLRFFVNHPTFGLGKDLAALSSIGLGLSLEDATGDLGLPGAATIDTFPGDLTRGSSFVLRPASDACLRQVCPDCPEAPDGSEAELVSLPAAGEPRRLMVAPCDGQPARLLLHLPQNGADERLLDLSYGDLGSRLSLPWLAKDAASP